MQRSRRRAFARLALLALGWPTPLGWATALHAAGAGHAHGETPHHSRALPLDLALHGHAHGTETPPHGHPLFVGSAVPLPGKAHVLAGARVGNSPEPVVVARPGPRLRTPGESTHDPPPRNDTVSILRI